MTPEEFEIVARATAIDLTVFAGYERLDEWAGTPAGRERLVWLVTFLQQAEALADVGRFLHHPPMCWYGKPRKEPIQGQTHYPCSCGLLDYLDTLPDGIVSSEALHRIRHKTPIDTPEWLRRSK